MERRLVFFLCLLIATAPLLAQDRFAGNWYSFSRNRVLRFNIGSDSIINQHMNFDLLPMTQRDVYRQAMAIRSLRNEGDCLLLQLAELDQDSVRNFPGRFCLYDAGLHYFSDSASLPMDFINEGELDRMRRLPPIDSMDAAGLERYVTATLAERAHTDSLSTSNVDPARILYHVYHRVRVLMAAAGYSPLYHNAQFEAVIRRFRDNPKTAGLVEQLLQEN